MKENLLIKNSLIVVSVKERITTNEEKERITKEIKEGFEKGFLIKDSAIANISIINKETGTPIAYI